MPDSADVIFCPCCGGKLLVMKAPSADMAAYLARFDGEPHPQAPELDDAEPDPATDQR